MSTLDRWRAPRWMPLFIRRRFMGVWTQAEVDDINRRADIEWQKVQRLFD